MQDTKRYLDLELCACKHHILEQADDGPSLINTGMVTPELLSSILCYYVLAVLGYCPRTPLRIADPTVLGAVQTPREIPFPCQKDIDKLDIVRRKARKPRRGLE